MINRLLLRLKRPRPNNDSVKRRFGNKTNQSPSLMPGAAHQAALLFVVIVIMAIVSDWLIRTNLHIPHITVPCRFD